MILSLHAKQITKSLKLLFSWLIHKRKKNAKIKEQFTTSRGLPLGSFGVPLFVIYSLESMKSLSGSRLGCDIFTLLLMSSFDVEITCDIYSFVLSNEYYYF